MPRITYLEDGGERHEVDVKIGSSVMEGARTHDIPGIDADCGGAAACATCNVFVDPAWRDRIDPPAPEELEMLELVSVPGEGSRLSCQIKVTEALDGLIVRLPVTQR